MIDNLKQYLNKSFQKKIIAVFLLLNLALLLLFFGISYILAITAVNDDTQKNMQNTGQMFADVTEGFVNSKAALMNSIINSNDVRLFLSENAEDEQKPIKSYNNYSSTISALNSIFAADPYVVSSWVVSDSKGFLLTNSGYYADSSSFNMNSQQWYSKIISNTKDNYCWVSSVMKSIENNASVISFVSPVIENGNIIGYVGMELSSDSLQEYINSYYFKDGSYPLIISENGDVIYNSSNSSFKDTFDISQYPLNSIIAQASSDLSEFESFVYSGNTYYRYKKKCGSWYCIVLFDKSVTVKNMSRFFMQEIIILLCLIILMFIINVNIIRKESRDLKKITDNCDKISLENYYDITDTYSENEIGNVGKTLTAVVKELYKCKNIIKNSRETDSLTKIPNRISLYENINEMILCSEGDCKRFALMFVDLDNFKWMNETLGHKFGDDCLVKFAAQLSDTLSGIAKVFRFSGDEFVILADCSEGLDPVNEIIEKINTAFDRPISVCNDSIYIRFSIGVSIFPDDDSTADMLLRDADMALHRAKENGKDRVAFYNNITSNNTVSSASIAQRLVTALGNNELSLNYQPIISTQTNDIHGFEVLVRWNSIEFGSIPPAEFIKVAEETGAIIQIGTWVFESACRFLKSLCETYKRDIIMSINVSPVQLKRSDYLDHVKRVIEITQINPKNIQIEITESTLIDFTNSDNGIIQKINEMGISLALDDFGTGYSSLNYLKNMPIKCLKVDKSFIDEIYNSKKDYTITDSIIDLVHNLGIKTVAEGVETVGQYKFLKEMKCDYIQGFLMSKPLNEEDAVEFVEKYDLIHKPNAAMLEKNEKILADERKEKKRLEQEAKNSNSTKGTINHADTILLHTAK
jgi:diguanylate cyclase (GGDEF)-like protein